MSFSKNALMQLFSFSGEKSRKPKQILIKKYLKQNLSVIFIFLSTLIGFYSPNTKAQSVEPYNQPYYGPAVKSAPAQRQYIYQGYSNSSANNPNHFNRNSFERNFEQHSGVQYAQNPIYYIQGNRPCWDAAAAYHHVDPWLLYSIAYVESRFNQNAVGRNTNGTVDVGMMQINSIWYPTLRRQGIPMSALKNACASTYIGAWILSKNIKTYGYTWRAIGAYNSATPSKAYAYAKKVYAAHQILTQTHNPAALWGYRSSSFLNPNLNKRTNLAFHR